MGVRRIFNRDLGIHSRRPGSWHLDAYCATVCFFLTSPSLSTDGGSLYTPVSGNADIPYARIDLVRGEAFPLGTATTGVPFYVPNAIEVTSANRIFALDSTGALLIIDPETGERSIISK